MDGVVTIGATDISLLQKSRRTVRRTRFPVQWVTWDKYLGKRKKCSQSKAAIYSYLEPRLTMSGQGQLTSHIFLCIYRNFTLRFCNKGIIVTFVRFIIILYVKSIIKYVTEFIL